MTTTPTFWSDDFQVNTTSSIQAGPQLVGLASGGFVAVWYRSGAVSAKVFDVLGNPVGTEIVVNTTSVSGDTVDVAAVEGGGFVVVWDTGAADDETRARRFNDDGTAIDANEFTVNSTTTNDQFEPSVAGLADGGFVVVFRDTSGASGDIRARHFDADGVAAGNDFVVNATLAGGQFTPDVAALTNGGFVAVWTDNSGTGGDPDNAVRAQLLNALGDPVGSEFLVNTTTSGSQSSPRAAALENGNVVVIWQDFGQTGFDTSNAAIRGQVIDVAGDPVGSEFLMNTTVIGNQSLPDITALSDGGFFAVWADNSETGGDTDDGAIRGQRFAADGTRLGEELLINQATADDQDTPAVTVLKDGRIVVAFEESAGLFTPKDVLVRILDPRDAEIQGTNENDVIAGRLGDTEIKGHDGDDTITGMGGDDMLVGGAGNDSLNGGAGHDDLRGGSGDDTLNGGAGRDALRGGSGDDIFDFDLVTDSRVQKNDVIKNFDRGDDLIDLEDIDAKDGANNQPFKWIGKQGFHKKKGELHYVKKGDYVLVQGDTDGNGKADFQIKVDDVSKLSAGDFIL